jgi:hypothetical protein|nr:MAG TPA: YopX protein [Caudoviricetes sp.]
MIPKFRAYDGGSLNRMYQPDEVMVGNGDIWIIDEDSVAGEWIVNNDLNLMQSTGLFDKKGVEIFEGDIITNGPDVMCMKRHNTLGFYVEEKGKVEFIADSAVLEDFEEDAKEIADRLEIIGNIYENTELLEEKE